MLHEQFSWLLVVSVHFTVIFYIRPFSHLFSYILILIHTHITHAVLLKHCHSVYTLISFAKWFMYTYTGIIPLSVHMGLLWIGAALLGNTLLKLLAHRISQNYIWNFSPRWCVVLTFLSLHGNLIGLDLHAYFFLLTCFVCVSHPLAWRLFPIFPINY